MPQTAKSATAAMAKTGTNITSFTPQYGAPEQFSRSYGATGPWTRRARDRRARARLTLDVEGRSARDIFGPIDEMKFRSSMTLFAHAAPDDELFQRCLDKYFAGSPDPATTARL